ncbi:MAG: Stealth CR1 domain-containing protein [Bacteroidaceae bacterium]|nr:Stealth CR1 domain-containing protein [Bacteroidaceae bacterium]
MEIDFVMCWVDGGDPVWQQKRCQYKGTPYQHSDTRYREWGILRYWFRAVEQYAPWVNHIYFITDGQCPEWLNLDSPKLTLVDHRDFIPHEHLPTFQANTIELNLHRIKGLSEHFVFFNDDMYINAPIEPTYYYKDGLPCDATLESLFLGRSYSPVDEWGISLIDFCNTHVINAHFDRKTVVAQARCKWLGGYLGLKYQLQALIISLFGRREFQHFYTPHNEKPFLKSVYKEAWEREPKMLTQSCTRFRENTNLSSYFMRYWQLCTQRFTPTPPRFDRRKVYALSLRNISTIAACMHDDKVTSLCLNDASDISREEFEAVKTQIQRLFAEKLPERSSFEKA